MIVLEDLNRRRRLSFEWDMLDPHDVLGDQVAGGLRCVRMTSEGHQ